MSSLQFKQNKSLFGNAAFAVRRWIGDRGNEDGSQGMRPFSARKPTHPVKRLS